MYFDYQNATFALNEKICILGTTLLVVCVMDLRVCKDKIGEKSPRDKFLSMSQAAIYLSS